MIMVLDSKGVRWLAATAIGLALLMLGASVGGAGAETTAQLLGTTSIGSYADYNDPGIAEAFQATANASGTVSSLSVYVSQDSRSPRLFGGLYADSGGKPGALLGGGSVTPTAGAWNSIGMSASVTAGGTYWIAVLGTGGALHYSNTRNGSTAYASPGALSDLPSSFPIGKSYRAGPVSAYAVGSAPDTQAPTTPTGLATSNVGQTSVTLSWSAASDDVGVAGYKLSSAGSQVATTASTSYTFSGLSCGTSYTLGVSAYDAAGNTSSTATANAATAACAAPAPPDDPPASDPPASDPPASSPPASGDTTLLGTSSLTSSGDWNPAGMAEAFRTTASGSGTLTSLSVYVDSGSGASKLDAGLYGDSGGKPGALVAQGSLASPVAGAWNKVALSGKVSAGATYWIAVLAPSGTLRYRDSAGGATAYASSGGRLTSLPSTWKSGSCYAAGPVSAYAIGIAASTPPAGDSTPPSIPSGLAVSSVSQTGVTLSWKASSDDTGVAGYRLSANGSQAGTTTSTSYAFSGLGCGASYTLGVSAYDAAGNASAMATVTVSTAACSSGGVNASVYLSPSGSDANGCTQAAPCLTFNRGYRAALAGQTVALLGGSYGSQSMSADSSKTGPGLVTFAPAPGASVQVASIDNEGASFVAFSGLSVSGTITIQNTNPGSLGAHNVTLQGDSAKTVHIVGQVANISILGGSYGNTTNSQPQIKRYNPTDAVSSAPSNILVDGVSFHDYRRSDTSVHTECLQILDGNTITVRKSRFWNCDGTGDIGITPNSTIVNLTMENNFIGGGGDTGYGVQIGTQQQNFVFRNNSSTQPVFFSDSMNGYGPYTFTANYMPYSYTLCRSNATYSHNVLKGGSCSSTDKDVSVLSFVDPGAHDLHLAPGSAAIDAGPASGCAEQDIDGQTRPMGPAPDAGADESA
jgi:chitodextrinase